MVLCGKGAKYEDQPLGCTGGQLQSSDELGACRAGVIKPGNKRAELIAFNGLFNRPESINRPVSLDNQNSAVINTHCLECGRIRCVGWC